MKKHVKESQKKRRSVGPFEAPTGDSTREVKGGKRFDHTCGCQVFLGGSVSIKEKFSKLEEPGTWKELNFTKQVV